MKWSLFDTEYQWLASDAMLIINKQLVNKLVAKLLLRYLKVRENCFPFNYRPLKRVWDLKCDSETNIKINSNREISFYKSRDTSLLRHQFFVVLITLITNSGSNETPKPVFGTESASDVKLNIFNTFRD